MGKQVNNMTYGQPDKVKSIEFYHWISPLDINIVLLEIQQTQERGFVGTNVFYSYHALAYSQPPF